MALTDKLKNIGDAIRFKTGKSEALSLDEMVTEIINIPTGSSDEPFEFGGVNAELLEEYSENFNLADTSFIIGSTAPSTATSIKATVSNRFTTQTISIGDRDIIVVQTVLVTPTHSNGITPASQGKYGICHVTNIAKGRSGASTSTITTRRVISASYAYMTYYNTSSALVMAATSYGMYATPQPASVASTTAASTTVRVSSPILYARTNATYETAANMNAITECIWEWKARVYAVDPQTNLSSAMQRELFGVLFP